MKRWCWALPLVMLTACGHPLPQASQARLASPVAAHAAVPSASLNQIQGVASNALKALPNLLDWDARFNATNHAVVQIFEVQLEDRSLVNLAAKLAIFAATGYGYMGFKPGAEDRYRMQVVALEYVAASHAEADLARGEGVVKLARNMITATSGYDAGCKIGISVLSGLRDTYKDPTIARLAKDTLAKARAAADQPACYQAMLDGLDQMAETLR